MKVVFDVLDDTPMTNLYAILPEAYSIGVVLLFSPLYYVARDALHLACCQVPLEHCRNEKDCDEKIVSNLKTI